MRLCRTTATCLRHVVIAMFLEHRMAVEDLKNCFFFFKLPFLVTAATVMACAGMRPNFFLVQTNDMFMSVLRIISSVSRI